MTSGGTFQRAEQDEPECSRGDPEYPGDWGRFRDKLQVCPQQPSVKFLTLRYWKRKAKVQIVEPNPHFVPFFEERRKGYPELEIKDMVQV